jgi:hypothetical protein
VATSAASEIESAAGAEGRAGFEEIWVGIGGLRFASEEFRVPALAVVSRIDGHLVDVTPVWY